MKRRIKRGKDVSIISIVSLKERERNKICLNLKANKRKRRKFDIFLNFDYFFADKLYKMLGF